MPKEPTAFTLPLKELAIDIDQQSGEITIALATAMQAAAAIVPPEQFQLFIAQALALAGQALPHRSRSTHTADFRGASVPVDMIGFAPGESQNGETTLLIFPLGPLEVAFEIRTGQLVGGLQQYLSQGAQGGKPAKPN